MKDLIHFKSALRCSLSGIRSAFKHEIAFRHDVWLGVLNIIGLVFVHIPCLVKLFLFVLWGGIIVTELINSAIEAVVDLVSPEWNELARDAKDMGSAAVFCAVLLLVVSWCVVLVKYFLYA